MYSIPRYTPNAFQLCTQTTKVYCSLRWLTRKSIGMLPTVPLAIALTWPTTDLPLGAAIPFQLCRLLLAIHLIKYAHHFFMMTSSNANIFRVTGLLWGESTGPRWIPPTKPVTRSFGAFFGVRLNERLCKQSWFWWYETPPRSLWRQCNVLCFLLWLLMWLYHQFLGFMWHIYPYPYGLLRWHWDNLMHTPMLLNQSCRIRE